MIITAAKEPPILLEPLIALVENAKIVASTFEGVILAKIAWGTINPRPKAVPY